MNDELERLMRDAYYMSKYRKCAGDPWRPEATEEWIRSLDTCRLNPDGTQVCTQKDPGNG